MKRRRREFIPNFKIPELELRYRSSKLYYLSFFKQDYTRQTFKRYKEGIRYIYGMVENNELDLSLESYLALIKECKKIGVLDGIRSK